jgi:hypothetical protein
MSDNRPHPKTLLQEVEYIMAEASQWLKDSLAQAATIKGNATDPAVTKALADLKAYQDSDAAAADSFQRDTGAACRSASRRSRC